jgi:hypothetical protein
VTSPLSDLDPFDLPDWLGEGAVTWAAETGVRRAHRIRGHLSGAGPDVPCDLLAVDEAYPAPVADAATRTRAHVAWRHGQILLLSDDDRLVLVVPGTGFSADLVLDALTRLAKAVGASPENYVALLRIGSDRR